MNCIHITYVEIQCCQEWNNEINWQYQNNTFFVCLVLDFFQNNKKGFKQTIMYRHYKPNVTYT